jgi:membrane-associated phospholipid phosphatase
VTLRSGLALAALFALLAVTVSVGLLSGVDQWGVEHLMPGADTRTNESSLLSQLVPLWGSHWRSGWAYAANIVTVPASFLLSVLLVAWRSRVLAVAMLAAVAVEVVCKEVIVRPPLYTFVTDKTSHIAALDSSFPSGHTLRAVILAGAFFPLLRWWAVAWCIAALALLQLAGWHTPTDIAGGLLLAALALLGARCAGALRARGA